MPNIVALVLSRRESGIAFRGREAEAHRAVERIARERLEAVVPHQPREERGVDHRWRAALVARAGTIRADKQIALHADRHRLGIAHAVRGGMATATRVIAAD